MDNKEFLEKLKQVCEAFDNNMGEYPEHRLEGAALYYWVELYLAEAL